MDTPLTIMHDFVKLMHEIRRTKSALKVNRLYCGAVLVFMVGQGFNITTIGPVRQRVHGRGNIRKQ